MQRFIVFVLVYASIVDYLTTPNPATGGGGWLPGSAAYLMELSGVAALLIVVALGTRDRFANVRGLYWLIFGFLLAIAVSGAIANSVDTGPIFAGTRNYLRALPFFFLPAVVSFSEAQIHKQLRVLTFVSIAQLPLAVQQRLATRALGEWTGDLTVGTLGLSSFLSLFLICGICVVAGLYLKAKIRASRAALLFVLMIIPTTINETKGTFVLLPLGLLVTFLVGGAPGLRLRRLGQMTAILAVFLAAFSTGYNYWTNDVPYPVYLEDYLTDSNVLESYLYSGDTVGATEKAGRVDAILIPIEELAKQPVGLAIGLGIGNSSHSALGEEFTGHYYPLFFPFLRSTGSIVILELGIFGMAAVLLLMLTVFWDSCSVSRQDNTLVGAIATGWAGATVVMTIGLFYKDLIPSDALSYLFWYFSGIVAAQRMRLIAMWPAGTAQRASAVIGPAAVATRAPAATAYLSKPSIRRGDRADH